MQNLVFFKSTKKLDFCKKKLATTHGTLQPGGILFDNFFGAKLMQKPCSKITLFIAFLTFIWI
jgi:hypothetical protein